MVIFLFHVGEAQLYTAPSIAKLHTICPPYRSTDIVSLYKSSYQTKTNIPAPAKRFLFSFYFWIEKNGELMQGSALHAGLGRTSRLSVAVPTQMGVFVHILPRPRLTLSEKCST